MRIARKWMRNQFILHIVIVGINIHCKYHCNNGNVHCNINIHCKYHCNNGNVHCNNDYCKLSISVFIDEHILVNYIFLLPFYAWNILLKTLLKDPKIQCLSYAKRFKS